MDIETVFWFSQLSDLDVWKCLDFHKRHSAKDVAGEIFGKYSLTLAQPQLARCLMRGFLDVPAEKVKPPKNIDYKVPAIKQRFQGRIIPNEAPPDYPHFKKSFP